MERPPPVSAVEIELSQTESLLKLVIDSAGKVRSVEQMNGSQTVDEGLLAFHGELEICSRVQRGPTGCQPDFSGRFPASMLREWHRHSCLCGFVTGIPDATADGSLQI